VCEDCVFILELCVKLVLELVNIVSNICLTRRHIIVKGFSLGLLKFNDFEKVLLVTG